MARGLGSHDALVLFPEGHDFSLRRRRAAIDSLRQRGHEELAGKADQMANVLAPRIGGVTAAIAAAPEADVVCVAHTLFEVVGTDRRLDRGPGGPTGPLHRRAVALCNQPPACPYDGLRTYT